MSDFTIRSSLEVELTKAPAIAIAGASGSGKTESAMRLARGWCNAFGPNEKFAVIDTEEKRALYKKSRHQPWDWIDFQPPFTPERTWEALAAVKGYRAVILDSTSHEYAGEGGLQEIADEELQRLSGGDPKKMERLVAPSWKPAKRRHKHELMSRT
jgi:ABC-type transport system involved in cytochrome c biogenesis ATPase subunit